MTKKGDLDKILTFFFTGGKISFKLTELLKEQHHKRVVLNIKQTFREQYGVLGEPVFKKYFTVNFST